MKMLSEIEKRGQSSREMTAMQENLKRRGVEIAMALDKAFGEGKTIEDPEVMKLIAQGQMLAGMNGGQGMGKGMEALIDNVMAEKLLPNTTKARSEKLQAEADKKLRASVVGIIANKHSNVTATDVINGINGDFSGLDEAVGFSQTQKMANDAMELKELYKNEKAVNAYTMALYSGASFEELGPLMEAMGRPVKESQEERRIGIAKRNAGTSRMNAETAQSRLSSGSKVSAADAASAAIKKHEGDKEAAKNELREKLSGVELFEALGFLEKYKTGSDPGEFGKQFGKALAEGLR